MHAVLTGEEQAPPAAAEVFGSELPLAARFAQLLVTDAMVRGVIGPQESARIWSRHLLNCAVVAELFPLGSRVVDVGSGAGLPGIAVAVRRPDLQVDLVEPLQRRVDFLTEAVAALGLRARVRVVRGRADSSAVLAAVGGAPWVTARAVAPLDRLVQWCLPLVAPSGRLALVKGESVAAEVDRHRASVCRAGGTDLHVVRCGRGLIDPAVPVVVLGRLRLGDAEETT